jgi:hypothetical protein
MLCVFELGFLWFAIEFSCFHVYSFVSFDSVLGVELGAYNTID